MMMRRVIILIMMLLTVGIGTITREFRPPERPAAAELGMSIVGSTIAGATSWGAYLLWDWGSKAITPDNWDQSLGIIGQVGLFGLGYGVLIPAGAYSGISSMAINAGDHRSPWGAVLGAYAGTAASIPFAVMALDNPTWLNTGLAAGSVIILPSFFSWIGFRLTPAQQEQADEASLYKPILFVTYDSRTVSAGIRIPF